MTIYSNELIGKKEQVSDEMLLLSPLQTPLLSLVGFDKPIGDVSLTWYEDQMFATATTLTAALDATATTIEVSSTEPFVVDAVAEINDELVLVNAVNKDNKTITVTRGYANTDKTTAAVGDTIEFQFVINEEGSESKPTRFKEKKTVNNVTQIFKESISVSGTAMSVDMYGQGESADTYQYEKLKKEEELAAQLERALIGGKKIDNGNIRTMAGIRQFIKTNVVDAAGQPITADMITSLSKELFERGAFNTGAKFVLMVGAKQKVAISNLQSDKVRITQQEAANGRVVDTLLNDFVELPIILNNNLKPDEVFLVDIERIKIRPLADRAFHHVYEGVKGDSTNGFVIGEYTLEFHEESAQARIKNLA